jgi:threonine/homoserine/homoserine lactone efflux protein
MLLNLLILALVVFITFWIVSMLPFISEAKIGRPPREITAVKIIDGILAVLFLLWLIQILFGWNVGISFPKF